MFSKIHHILNNQEQLENSKKPVQLQINNTFYLFDSHKFSLIQNTTESNANTITYIDGGSAILASGATFSLSFIRIAAYTQSTPTSTQTFQVREFFLLTLPKYIQNEFLFENHIFEHKNTLSKSSPPLNVSHLQLKTTDESIKQGISQAPPTKIIDLARRLAELQLTIDLQSTYTEQSNIFVLDGTLTPSYPFELEYIKRLSATTCSIAKSSTLLTTTNESINVFLKKHGPTQPWTYSITPTLHFTKLHEKSNHIFRAEGAIEHICKLSVVSNDATFPGYPYGLIKIDQLARITNEEKRILTTKFLSHKDAKIITTLLTTQDSHSILDNIR